MHFEKGGERVSKINQPHDQVSWKERFLSPLSLKRTIPGLSLVLLEVMPLAKSVLLFTQSCLTLCNPMDCSTPGLPVHHCLPELAQTQVHWVHDAIQTMSPSVALLFPSSILDTSRARRLTFWCHIFLLFHNVHGVLKARIWKWFAIPFSRWWNLRPMFSPSTPSYSSCALWPPSHFHFPHLAAGKTEGDLFGL